MTERQGISETQIFANDVSAFAMMIDEMKFDTADDRLAVAEMIDKAIKDLRLVSDSLRDQVARQMESAGVKEQMMMLGDGSKVNVVRETKITRTAIQTEDLVKAVERAGSVAKYQFDPETGEIMNLGEAKLLALKEAFRFEPRWSVIKDLGINDDEFCQKRYKSTANIERGRK